MKDKTVRAYHFVGEKLRDGRDVPADGVWLKHDGAVILCEEGLHASIHPADALGYAPGETLCLVDVRGRVIHGADKLAASERRIVKRINSTPLLREYARWCALQVVELWDAPDVVRQYLTTGDEGLRYAAGAAAESAVRAAAGAAAEYAARAAAGAAAEYAARAAAGAAEEYAAWAAARASAESAVRAAAEYAAWATAWAAVRAAEEYAARAAEAYAARAAAESAQRERLQAMVDVAFKEAKK